jgi:hypothetical protein
VDDRLREQGQLCLVWRLKELRKVFLELFCGDGERIGPAFGVTALESSRQLVDRHVEIVKLDIYAEFVRFAPFLGALVAPPQALFEDDPLPEPYQLLTEAPQLGFKQVVKLLACVISFDEVHFQGRLPLVGAQPYRRNLAGQLTRQGGLSRSGQAAHQDKTRPDGHDRPALSSAFCSEPL